MMSEIQKKIVQIPKSTCQMAAKRHDMMGLSEVVQEDINSNYAYIQYIYIYMYICICVYININVCVYIYEYPFLHIYIHTIPIPQCTYTMSKKYFEYTQGCSLETTKYVQKCNGLGLA